MLIRCMAGSFVKDDDEYRPGLLRKLVRSREGFVSTDDHQRAVDALRAIAAYAASPHPEPCGTDACLLCLIHGTAQPHAEQR